MAYINVEIDERTIKEVTPILEQIGLSLNDALSIYLNKIAKEHRIPFEISIDPFYSPENQKRLLKSIAQMNEIGGKIVDL